MGEIREEAGGTHISHNCNEGNNNNNNNNNMEEARGERRKIRSETEDDDSSCKNTVEITLKTIGPSPPARITVPSPIQVHKLRKLIAESNGQPIENLKLILRGKALPDTRDEDDVHLVLNDGDSLMVVVKPKPPARHLRDGFDLEDDDLKFRLPQSTSQWKKRLYFFLHEKLKLPDVVLMALFSLTLKAWMFTIIWFILAPVAHSWDLGPLYILATGFAIIFVNLGRRQAGDVSAYSIFNEDFRELPGTLNADRLDRDIRAGQF